MIHYMFQNKTVLGFFWCFKMNEINIFDRTENEDFFPWGFPPLCLSTLSLLTLLFGVVQSPYERTGTMQNNPCGGQQRVQGSFFLSTPIEGSEGQSQSLPVDLR